MKLQEKKKRASIASSKVQYTTFLQAGKRKQNSRYEYQFSGANVSCRCTSKLLLTFKQKRRLYFELSLTCQQTGRMARVHSKLFISLNS